MKFNNIFMSSFILGTAIFAADSGIAQSGIVGGSNSYNSGVERLSIIPARGDDFHMAREYDDAHLIKNKKQFFTYVDVTISNIPYEGLTFTMFAYIRNIQTGTVYENRWINSGNCSIVNDFKISCSTPSGSFFTLTQKTDHITLEIPKGRALALVEENSSRRLVLDGNDEDNRSFWLFEGR